MHARFVLAALLCTGLTSAQDAPYREAPIRYGEGASDDAVARLAERLAAGKGSLPRDERRGYLPALLAALDIPAASQALVFSKTSFQNRLIGPHNPRAVYFGDDAYVGYVPGGEVLEVTAMDPLQGPVFYTLDQRAEAPRFRRRIGECLTCHASGRTGGWPAHLVRSVHADAHGHPSQTASSFVTTHDSPLAQRWGGWYVTGTHGAQRHMGNVTLATDADQAQLDRDGGANVTDLRGRLATDRYLTPHSDLVALMVLEHQTQMHNLLARASYRVRRVLHLQAATNRVLGDPPEHLSDTSRQQIQDAANDVLEYLLFKNEARLTAPVRGTSSFAADFAARGRQDSRGRSLRDFDLQTRLFRYPCSYLIYSPSFDALPAAVLEIVYTRLWRILTGRFGRRSWPLGREQRQAILDILLQTKPGLPAAWHPVEVR